ncbi:MAG: hypothetical protein E6Q83_07935 [Thiothrix sp.]|nr:MAG: hypothetical protein E6Q83_07935 [Thiothrix sp.]
MNNSIDYHSTLLARKLYRESQSQAAKQVLSTPLNLEDIIPATDTQADLLDYPVFSNPACGCLDGQEALQGNQQFQDYWFNFYPPQANLLPQHANLDQLHLRRQELHRSRATQYAPRLFMLTVLSGMFVLGLLSQNWLLPLLTLVLVLVVWLKTHRGIQDNSEHLARNHSWIQQQAQLLKQLEHQCQLLTKPADAKILQQNYTRQLEAWLHDSVNEFFPSLQQNELKTQLQTGDINFFLLESRAILQLLPNEASPNKETLQALLSVKGKSLFALQPYPHLEGLSRLHYLYALLCFEQGVVICTAFYDWISNDLYSVQQDFHPYREIMEVHHGDLRPNEHNPVQGYISDEIFQRQIREPLQVVALGLRNGRHYACTLSKIPLHRRTYLQLPNLFFNHYLKRDIRQLIATLTKHTAA